MKTSFTSLAVVAMLLSACALARQQDRPTLRERLAARSSAMPAAAAIPGVVETTLAFGGVQRSYLVLDASQGRAAAPLVVLLHGGGGNGATMIARWQAKAAAEGLILVAPNGIGRKANSGTWNAGGCCGEAMASGSEDVRFVGAVIDDVSRTTRVDASRVYVAGLSNGGMLAHRVAIAYPRRLAGAAVVAGALFGDEPAPRVPVPMLIMHGMKDQVVGYEGGMSPTRFVARAQSQPFKPVAYAVDFWRRADGCGGAPVVSTEGDVTTETSNACAAGAEVRFYRLASADHGWPGPATGEKPLVERQHYDDIDATSVIWDFFKTHTRASAL
ncbi:alpha/beta hydrolase family esterase [Oxalobacteraceae bacterium A2-2]